MSTTSPDWSIYSSKDIQSHDPSCIAAGSGQPAGCEGWHYNLFAMVHGRTAEEIEAYRAEIRRLLGSACRAEEMLVSSRILKKTGLRVGRRG